ncbi:50S ribosomal protein L21 [Candidatus Ishikawella capsulata]|nr:50S ribosomal protein L21 [Candidatus Ishikawaella capsulata]
MYAIFENGGKQYIVSEGQAIRLEKINLPVGDKISFNKILLVSNDKDINIGTPIISGSVINGEIIAHGRKEKIKIIKFRRRKHYKKQQGHRQWFTDVKICSIII